MWNRENFEIIVESMSTLEEKMASYLSLSREKWNDAMRKYHREAENIQIKNIGNVKK